MSVGNCENKDLVLKILESNKHRNRVNAVTCLALKIKKTDKSSSQSVCVCVCVYVRAPPI